MQRRQSWLHRIVAHVRLERKSHLKDFGSTWRFQSYYYEPGKPVWMRRDYGRFAEEAYIRNVIAHRCISLIARNAASVAWQLFNRETQIKEHPVLALLAKPNPCCAGPEFFESVHTARMIGGNAYILAVTDGGGRVRELHSLRPDRVMVVAGKEDMPAGYHYTVGKSVRHYPVDRLTGRSAVLHLKHFHPLDDWYGLSPVESAAYSIDQHNQAAVWNQALLQNGARPTGALVVKGADMALDEDQFTRLKAQINEQFSGAANAGRPLLLEGGLEWKEMSLSPKDMDFIEAKHSAARDIALAFGVPPQILGIPGDNTYSNLAEARLALWEHTILPLLDHIAAALNLWLLPYFGADLKLSYDADAISALAPRRERVWSRIKNADFLTDEEKRAMVGIKSN